MNFLQLYELEEDEYGDGNINNAKSSIFLKSYTTYTIGYKDPSIKENELTEYFLNIKNNVRLSLLNEYKNKKLVTVAPRTDSLPSWSSICKNIFCKAGVCTAPADCPVDDVLAFFFLRGNPIHWICVVCDKSDLKYFHRV